MCGRFALTSPPDAVRALFGYADAAEFPPRTSIAPTEPVGVVTLLGGALRFVLMRWGFVPAWCKDPATFPLLFNARGETLVDKPAFRNAVRRRRCLVPADGFYEWQRRGEGRQASKQPYLVTRRDGRTAALAALWETYAAPDGGEIDTTLIVTTNANGLLSVIHERMPVIVEPGDFQTWLDVTSDDPRAALALVRPAADDVLTMEPCEPQRGEAVAPQRGEAVAPSARPHRAPGVPTPERDAPTQGELF
jgi:putative SOS response-associated peptidase YedK